MKPRPILNRQETKKKIQRDLAIAKRKMEQIIKHQVKFKLTTLQVTNLGNIIGTGTALNTNTDRENANGQIFLNNLIKEISGKDILTFTPAPDHEGLELPHFNWARANKLLP